MASVTTIEAPENTRSRGGRGEHGKKSTPGRLDEESRIGRWMISTESGVSQNKGYLSTSFVDPIVFLAPIGHVR